MNFTVSNFGMELDPTKIPGNVHILVKLKAMWQNMWVSNDFKRSTSLTNKTSLIPSTDCTDKNTRYPTHGSHEFKENDGDIFGVYLISWLSREISNYFISTVKHI